MTYHSFSAKNSFSAKFFEKPTFLPPDTHTYVCVSGRKKCYFFGKFCARTKWMIPNNLKYDADLEYIQITNSYFRRTNQLVMWMLKALRMVARPKINIKN